MNKIIRKEIFKVLEEECKENKIEIGKEHIFQFPEINKGKNYLVTIIIEETKELTKEEDLIVNGVIALLSKANIKQK